MVTKEHSSSHLTNLGLPNLKNKTLPQRVKKSKIIETKTSTFSNPEQGTKKQNKTKQKPKTKSGKNNELMKTAQAQLLRLQLIKAAKEICAT